MELGSPESRAAFAASQNKKALAEQALKEKNKKIKEAVQKLQGTQSGHTVTNSSNHTKPIKSSGRGTVGGPIGDLGGGGMNWETK